MYAVELHHLMSREQCARLSSVIAVPSLLFLIDWLSQVYRSPESEFLLLPPLAVIVFLIFSRPDAAYVNLRSVVVTPILGSAVGELCYHWFGLTPWGRGHRNARGARNAAQS